MFNPSFNDLPKPNTHESYAIYDADILDEYPLPSKGYLYDALLIAGGGLSVILIEFICYVIYMNLGG